MPKTEAEAIHAVDKHVGERVRLRRLSLSMTQGDLAKALGLTFQQVQKYEKGTNRISASKLYDAARSLRVPIEYFFEGLPEFDTEAAAEVTMIHAILADREGLEFMRNYVALAPAHKTTLRNLAQQFSPE